MRILGIDPGTRRIGYGIIDEAGGKFSLVEAGLLKIQSGDDFLALKETKMHLDQIINSFKPEMLAIEKLYFAKNQKTALQVAQARGVLVLSAMEHGLMVREFSPNEVKMGLTGYGAASKQAVLKMVKLFLKEPDLKVIDDTSDALAIALLATQKQIF